MKLGKLIEIIIDEVDRLKLDIAYSDDISKQQELQSLSNRLDNYMNNLTCKFNINRSEYRRIYHVEIGEPVEFIELIKNNNGK